jgi:hypothetical protein
MLPAPGMAIFIPLVSALGTSVGSHTFPAPEIFFIVL